MEGKYDKLSEIILKNIGGKENVNSLTHCVTRIRFRLADESKADTEALKNTDGIVSVITSGGQYMVVIGNHVQEVYDSLVRVGGLESKSVKNSRAEDAQGEPSDGEGGNLFNAFISIVTGVFTPFLGILCACGIIKGFLALFVALGFLDKAGGTYNLLYSLGDSVFYFFPAVLGLSAAKKFRLPEMEGLVIGLAMVYPFTTAGSGYDISSLFHIPVIAPSTGDYTTTVLPVICAVAFAAWFERLYKKWVPDTIKLFAVPLITCFVTVCLTFWIIGPVTSVLSAWIGAFFNAVNDFSPIVMGLLVGFFWQILVMFGLHWALIPIAIVNMTVGGDVILSSMLGTTFAQAGACLGILLKTRDKKLKSLCPPAIISAVAGVTEPAIYGVTLPKKAPFFRTCAVSAVAGAVLCALGAKGYTMAGMGVFMYTMMITPDHDISKMILAIIVSVVCVLVSFILELLFYKEKHPEGLSEPDIPGGAGASQADGEELLAPVKGRVIPLREVPDEAFSSESLGPGAAVEPAEGKVYAPADGVVSTLFPTGHAVGITTAQGAELLIHVGMDTVEMNGDGFEPAVRQGASVERGDLLLKFDPDKIKQAGHPAITPVIVTNADQYAGIEITGKGRVLPGDPFIRLRK